MDSAPSPRALARIAGGLYLANILFGAFAIGVVPGIVVVSGDAAATAHNIQTHELLYRLGLAAHVVVVATNVPLAVIFYELFKVVNRRLALLVAAFTLVATSVEAASLVTQFVPVMGAPGAATVTLSMSLQAAGYDVSTVFFAFYALTIGYLIYRSRFLPRAIGVLMVLDGASYLLYSFSDFISPGFAAHLVPWTQLPILFGEGSLCVWLLIVGINAQRWSERAAAST